MQAVNQHIYVNTILWGTTNKPMTIVPNFPIFSPCQSHSLSLQLILCQKFLWLNIQKKMMDVEQLKRKTNLFWISGLSMFGAQTNKNLDIASKRNESRQPWTSQSRCTSVRNCFARLLHVHKLFAMNSACSECLFLRTNMVVCWHRATTQSSSLLMISYRVFPL